MDISPLVPMINDKHSLLTLRGIRIQIHTHTRTERHHTHTNTHFPSTGENESNSILIIKITNEVLIYPVCRAIETAQEWQGGKPRPSG